MLVRVDHAVVGDAVRAHSFPAFLLSAFRCVPTLLVVFSALRSLTTRCVQSQDWQQLYAGKQPHSAMSLVISGTCGFGLPPSMQQTHWRIVGVFCRQAAGGGWGGGGLAGAAVDEAVTRGTVGWGATLHRQRDLLFCCSLMSSLYRAVPESVWKRQRSELAASQCRQLSQIIKGGRR